MSTEKLRPGRCAKLAIFAVLFATTFMHAWLYRELWVLGFVVLLVVWAAASLIAIVDIGDVVRADLASEVKLRGIMLPMLALALPLVSIFSGFSRQAEASIFLMNHRDEMRQSEQRAPPGHPAKIDFLQGIPDGGQAIIRWSRNPAALGQLEQVKLTGERITRCRRIVPDAWLCSYD